MSSRQSSATLRAVVRHYRLRSAQRSAEDAWWCAEGCNFAAVIKRAATARTATGKHGHQNLIPPEVLEHFSRRLLAAEREISECKTFGQLFHIATLEAEHVKGVGVLAIYDTTDRIAHRLGLSPDRVYLHQGTRAGALALVGGLKPGAKTITIDQLPPELRALNTRQAEDVLCIYKNVFAGSSNVPSDDEASCGARRQRRRGGIC